MIIRKKSFEILTEETTICYTLFPFKFGDMTNHSQVAFLCALSKNKRVFEFGTYRGRTAYNLGQNAAEVYTLDGGYTGVDGYPPYSPGELFAGKGLNITQLIAQSTQFESNAYGLFDVVIVDGGHSYEVCRNDSLKALQLAAPGAYVIWDDYDPTWPGVIQCLNELSRDMALYYLEDLALVIHQGGSDPFKRSD